MSLIGGLSFNELKTMRQDEVRIVMEDWSDLKLTIAYKYLRGRGFSMESVDYRIDAAIKAELAAGDIKV